MASGAVGAATALAGCQAFESGTTPTDESGDGPDAPTERSERPVDGLSVSWTRGPDLPLRRTQTTAVAVEAYHPPSDAWTTVEPLPTPRWGLGAATLDDRIYTVGGGAVPSAEETRALEIMTVE